MKDVVVCIVEAGEGDPADVGQEFRWAYEVAQSLRMIEVTAFRVVPAMRALELVVDEYDYIEHAWNIIKPHQAVYMIEGWNRSRRARELHRRAIDCGMRVFESCAEVAAWMAAWEEERAGVPA